jgi:hypothetical protein
MAMSQLERDLSDRITERLHLWIDDSIQLYEMADVSRVVCIRDIVTQLLHALIGAAITFDIPPSKLSEMITDGVEYKKRKLREAGFDP